MAASPFRDIYGRRFHQLFQDQGASELADELADLSYAVWWDTSLLPTGAFGEAIDRQLEAAKAVIVIWSPESVQSKWVRSEAAHADRQDKLVNTHTAGIDPVRQIPKPFEQTHSVGLDNIRAIVAALDVLKVPRSGGRAGVQGEAQPPSNAADTDDRLFAEVERTGTAEAYEYYLDAMPEGRHAVIARFRLKGLQPASLDLSDQRMRPGGLTLRVCPHGTLAVTQRKMKGLPTFLSIEHTVDRIVPSH